MFMAKTKFRFLIFGLSHRLYGGSEVMVGSEDQHQFFFLKGIFVQEGSNGTCFDHGQLKLKPSLFTPHPNLDV